MCVYGGEGAGAIGYSMILPLFFSFIINTYEYANEIILYMAIG